ncbi:MAG: hypothetical protein K8S97_04610 [Anaerolineae bacterium]|nr:hypothetical protein [Anaerolineae bacterium]
MLTIVLIGGGSSHAVTAQDTPEYQFLLRISDQTLHRLDCSNHECMTYTIPLPLNEDCPFYQPLAPTPDGTRILLYQLCYTAGVRERAFLLDLQGDILAEYVPEPKIIWDAARRFARWSPDGSFVEFYQATAPGSFALAFYDPITGFTDAIRIGGRFEGFSPDGTLMLFLTQYGFRSDDPGQAGWPNPYGDLALAETSYIATYHEVREIMFLSDWQLWHGSYEAQGWLSNREIWLEDTETERHYRFDLDTGNMTLFTPPEEVPSLYNGGLRAQRTGNTITIWDTHAHALYDTLTFALPDELADFPLATCDYCMLYWLNPPENLQ